MKFLLDVSHNKSITVLSKYSDIIAGQLLTPLTGYKLWSDSFAIDNGAYSGFDTRKFNALLKRNECYRYSDRCKFVCMPDIVRNAQRTLELFHHWKPNAAGWPLAFVAQDGINDITIPWDEIEAIFIGGSTYFKTSQAVKDLIKTAHVFGKHIHVGRVNTPDRFFYFDDLGADTCDGSGVCKYDWMLEKIWKQKTTPQAGLFSTEGEF